MADTVKNIGPEGQRSRLLYGLAMLGIGLAIGVVLILADVSRWWRLALFLPFWQGGLGIFQSFHKT